MVKIVEIFNFLLSVGFEVFSIDSEWKYKNEQIRLVHRSKEPYPIMQMKPHPNESFPNLDVLYIVYTMATANGNGKVLIWDFNYDKHIKSFYTIGSHPVMCQGLSWCPFNPNLLLSCGQEGMICLWVHVIIFLYHRIVVMEDNQQSGNIQVVHLVFHMLNLIHFMRICLLVFMIVQQFEYSNKQSFIHSSLIYQCNNQSLVILLKQIHH